MVNLFMSDELGDMVKIKNLEMQEYNICWKAMQDFTKEREPTTIDEIWLLQHPPIFTVGQSGDLKHLKFASKIPTIRVDRGGQITYHGPGQLLIYTLINLRRKQWSIRELIQRLESIILILLSKYNITGTITHDAPGVYVASKKLCSVGLRVSRGYTFHGLALNVAMDLTPFQYINPCGYENLTMTSLEDLGIELNIEATKNLIIEILQTTLEYKKLHIC